MPRRPGAHRPALLFLSLVALLTTGCAQGFLASEPTPTRSLPTRVPSWTPGPTSTPRPTSTPLPSATPAPEGSEAGEVFTSDRFGLEWRAPSAAYGFTEAELEAPGLVALTTLVSIGPDEQEILLFALDQPPAIAALLRAQLETSPQTAVEQIAAQGGLPTDAVELIEIAGSPTILTTVEDLVGDENYLFIIIGPSGVFNALARGFDSVGSARVLFDTLSLGEGALAEEEDVTPSNRTEQLEELVDVAETIRGLGTREEVPFEFKGRDEFRLELEEDIDEEVDPDEIAAEDGMLKLLGLIPADTDLLELTLDLYGSQVAGFYDPDENIFFLIGEEAEMLDVNDRVTFFHEYVHALQDQHLGLDRFADDELDETRSADEAAAFRALVEGDAQLATTEYLFNNLSISDLGALLEESISEVDSEVLERTPPFLRQSLIFPYTTGMSFVQSVQQRGGWAAVDALWDELPRSTEQIMHPDRYPGDVPVSVNLPEGLESTLGAGWREGLRDVWGAWALFLMLDQQSLAGVGPDSAAEGWGGDQYLFLTDGERGVYLLEIVWDSAAEAEEGDLALREWLQESGIARAAGSRYAGTGRQGYLARDGDRTLLAIASEGVALDPLLDRLGWR